MLPSFLNGVYRYGSLGSIPCQTPEGWAALERHGFCGGFLMGRQLPASSQACSGQESPACSPSPNPQTLSKGASTPHALTTSEEIVPVLGELTSNNASPDRKGDSPQGEGLETPPRPRPSSPNPVKFSIAKILGLTPSPSTDTTPPAPAPTQSAEQDGWQEKFSWLQCTRYKPPRLPREKKKEGSKKRKPGRNPRVPFSQHQVAVLEEKFRCTHYLSSMDVTELAFLLSLSETRVKIWFQNRRARERRDRDCTQRSHLSSKMAPPLTVPSVCWPALPSRTSAFAQYQGELNFRSAYMGAAYSMYNFSSDSNASCQ